MKNLVPALIKAQSQFLPIVKDKVNPFFHSKYADLENVIECTKKALADNGLVVIQTFGVSEGKTTLWTYLYHTSGEFVSGVQYLDVSSDPQKLASASTYGRRYGYLAILGIAAEDDDGNVASQPKPLKQADKPIEQPKREGATAKDINLKGEIRTGVYNKEKGRSEYEIETSDNVLHKITVKKPLVELKDGQPVAILGYWTSEYNGKTYEMAKEVRLYNIESDIPF